jgi:hypothetical protein
MPEMNNIYLKTGSHEIFLIPKKVNVDIGGKASRKETTRKSEA